MAVSTTEQAGSAFQTPIHVSGESGAREFRRQQVTAEASVSLTIDGRPVTVPAGSTILDAAREVGAEVPVLCHSDRLDPAGVCRMCVVDTGERTLAASCIRECAEGMQVRTATESVQRHRKNLTALLMAEQPVGEEGATTGNCDLKKLDGQLFASSGENGDAQTPLSRWLLERGTQTDAADVADADAEGPAGNRLDDSSPVIAVDHSACILCDRCIRACDDVQSNLVIGRTGKGHGSRISFDLNLPMGDSTCVSCGECVSECPTNALTEKLIRAEEGAAKHTGSNSDGTNPVSLPLLDSGTNSLCPYCGVGCTTEIHSRDERIVSVSGRTGRVTDSRLCVKGRYGWDYTLDGDRLTKPLIRRDEAYPRGPLSAEVRSDRSRRRGRRPDPSEVLPAFREATWEEALELTASRLAAIRDQQGGDALAGFGSAKCSNEEAYLFQKLIRAGFGTNNVDHCTRLCHASSVAALMETIGSGAVTNVFSDAENADVILVTGSNTCANHPVAATFIKDAVRKGTRLIVVDPRGHELTRFADQFAQIHPGSDVAFYNSLMHVLIRDDLVDEAYVRDRTSGFDDLRSLVMSDYSPRQAESVCGVPARQIEEIAHLIGSTRGPDHGMLIFWGMGISQHSHGTNNARCLISLCLLTGNVGRPGSGLHPLRGQNNVQGASDAGLIPMVYPDYQPVAADHVREKFEAAWQRSLSPKPGLTVVEIMGAAAAGTIRGMYILGENPFLSDPNTNKVRKALSSLEFLVVQDIFLSETAEFADVILPAGSFFEKTGTYTNTDRRVQLGQPAMQPPGEARQDWEIICEISTRMGLPMPYESPADVFAEFASLTRNYSTLSHENLGAGGRLWPCPDPNHEDPDEADGIRILFDEQFPTADGRGRLVPCRWNPADELTNDDYPFILSTGRVLEHWHTGTMTRRSQALDAIEPEPFVAIHPDDLRGAALQDCERLQVESRRGAIEVNVRVDPAIDRGTVFIPFHFREAAANVLTNDALDPDGKIPEFKYCAVRLLRPTANNPPSTPHESTDGPG